MECEDDEMFWHGEALDLRTVYVQSKQLIPGIGQ